MASWRIIALNNTIILLFYRSLPTANKAIPNHTGGKNALPVQGYTFLNTDELIFFDAEAVKESLDSEHYSWDETIILWQT